MWIERIRLHDWKCFVEAKFDFPRPSINRPVVLIGAENGAGKTSLLEGLLFCLYGPQAIELIAERESDMARGTEGFRRFVSRAINNSARQQGRTRASLEVTFADEEERIRIERRFHTYPNGHFRDQELFVWRGRIQDEPNELDVINVPALADKDDFLRGYIAQRILPHNLAPFFFFDGEQVQRLASKDRSAATRDGLEQLFGVRILRTLQTDLRRLASDRRSKARVGNKPSKLAQLEVDIMQTQEKVVELEGNLNEIENLIPTLERKVDGLQSSIGLLIQGNTNNINEINKELHQAEQERRTILIELNEKLLGRDLAIALAHNSIGALRLQLDQEDRRISWEAARENMLHKLDKLILDFEEMGEPEVHPQLTEAQKDSLRVRLSKAYEGMFVPPPPNIAENVRHAYLGADNRAVVLDRLNSVQRLSTSQLTKLIERLEEVTNRRRRLGDDQQTLAEGTRASELTQSLRDAQENLTKQEESKLLVINQLSAEKRNLGNLTAERGRLEEDTERGDIENRVARRCDEIHTMLDSFIEDLRKKRNESLAQRMTEVYRKLARKEDVVKRIEIDPDGPVRLIGSDGRNLNEQDLSAGENEIFALSLLAAASSTVASDMPVIIDTPVARLDRTHRLNIARHYLPKAAAQIVLLSTDTELVGDFLEPIRNHIGASFLIDFNPTTEVSEVKVDAYFEPLDSAG